MRAWLNRNVIAMTVTSFLSDCAYEMVTAVLPSFLSAIGVAAAALGWIEGVADAISSSVKLGAGWWSDRVGNRKAIVVFGYALTAAPLGLFALATGWPLVLLGRSLSWLGRGIRGPLRDAMLSESVAPHWRGRAFGFHRSGDTLGAILGPLAGVALLSVLPAPDKAAPFRALFLLSLIPGFASAAVFAFVREPRRAAIRGLHLWKALRTLPPRYLRFLTGAGLFGLGDFSPALLILAAGAVTGARTAALLYAFRNVFYAASAFPVGWLSDRMDRQKLLAVGCALGALTAFATAALFRPHAPVVALAGVFAVAGIYMGMQDALEGAIPADLVAAESRGTAYGLMGAVNGVGDLVSSALVGTLWSLLSPIAGFTAAGALMLSGAFLMWWNARHA